MATTHTTFEIDALLRRVAYRQLGLVTVAQAERAGVDRFALHRRRGAGALETVFNDVLRLTSVAPTAAQRVLAGALAVPSSVIGGTSAAIVQQLPIPGEYLSLDVRPVVVVGPNRSARTPGVITVRQAYELPDRRWLTARVSTPAATLLMLPRFVDPFVVERCLDHALTHRLTTVRAVRELLDNVPTRAVHGRAVLAELLAQRSAGIGHRSGLEQQVGRWLAAAGLHGWTRNFPVQVEGGPPIEVDFAWPDQQVALEVSPFVTHGSRAQQERDMERRRFLVESGWRVTEATDPDLASRLAFRRTVLSLRTLLHGGPSGFSCAG
jgi:hypothetical protein